MAISRKMAWPNVEKLLERPRREVPITLRHTKQGIVLLTEGKPLTVCYANKNGKMCAELLAEALGVELPSLGESLEAKAASSVIYRAVSLSSLDLSIPGIVELVDRLLQDAAFQRMRAAEPPAEY